MFRRDFYPGNDNLLGGCITGNSSVPIRRRRRPFFLFLLSVVGRYL